MCELADGTVVKGLKRNYLGVFGAAELGSSTGKAQAVSFRPLPGSLVPWLEEAWVERVVFDGPSRVVDVGVARRLFTGATRRAVQVRDRECFHPLCDLPAEECQVDHVEPCSAGGGTVAANGRPACAHHNRRRHRRP